MQDLKLTKSDLHFLRKNLAQAIAEIDALYIVAKDDQPISLNEYPSEFGNIERVLKAIKEVIIEKEDLEKISEPSKSEASICCENETSRVDTPRPSRTRSAFKDAESHPAKAPWVDFAGNPIFAGSTLVHPNGDTGTVFFTEQYEDELCRWRVLYEDGLDFSLAMQIGEKGRAVVYEPKSEDSTGRNDDVL